jgi:hypothetical protein
MVGLALGHAVSSFVSIRVKTLPFLVHCSLTSCGVETPELGKKELA